MWINYDSLSTHFSTPLFLDIPGLFLVIHMLTRDTTITTTYYLINNKRNLELGNCMGG